MARAGQISKGKFEAHKDNLSDESDSPSSRCRSSAGATAPKSRFQGPPPDRYRPHPAVSQKRPPPAKRGGYPLWPLLGVVKGELGSGEVVVDLSCDVALEASDGFFLGESLCHPSCDVIACSLVGDHAG